MDSDSDSESTELSLQPLDPTKNLSIKDLHQVLEEMSEAGPCWIRLGLAFGLPKYELDNIKGDDDHLCSMLSACLNGSERMTWTKICKALRTNSVELPNLASRIENRFLSTSKRKPKRNNRSDGGSTTTESDSTATESADSTDGETSSEQPSPVRKQMKPNNTAEDEHEGELNNPLRAIKLRYEKLRKGTINSLRQSRTKPFQITSFLRDRVKRSIHSICFFSSIPRFDLESMEDIFNFIDSFTSFVNYGMLEEIIQEFGSESDKTKMKSYVKKLEIFFSTWQVKPLEIGKSLSRFQSELKMKVDTNNNSLKDYVVLKERIASVLEVSIGDVYLIRVDPSGSCIELVLAVPARLTVLVKKHPALTGEQIAKIDRWRQPTVLSVTLLRRRDDIPGDHTLYDRTRSEVPPATLLLRACRSSETPDIDQIRGYLEGNKDIVDEQEKDEFQWSPLMWACENKHFAICKLLLKYRPQVNDIQDKNDWSPLILACKAGDLEVVQGIVELGAYIDHPTNKKWTPLMWAAYGGHVEMTRFLLEKKASVDYPDVRGWTPLMQASQEGHVRIVNLLLDYKAKVNHQTETAWCALMAAAKNKHSEVVDTLLNRRATVDIEREDGTTTLQVASLFDYNSVVINTLINGGATVDHTNKEGMTALMIASAKVRDPFNNDCAVDRGRLDIVQALLNKASINDVHPGTGWTALFFAANAGYPTVFKELLSKGATPEIECGDVEDVARVAGHDKTILPVLQKFKEHKKEKMLERNTIAAEGTRLATERMEKINAEKLEVEKKRTRIAEKLLTLISQAIPLPLLEAFTCSRDDTCRNTMLPITTVHNTVLTLSG